MIKKILLLTSCIFALFANKCSKKEEKDQLKETLIAVFADNQIAPISTNYQRFLKNHLKKY